MLLWTIVIGGSLIPASFDLSLSGMAMHGLDTVALVEYGILPYI
jgi:hypothetical protein